MYAPTAHTILYKALIHFEFHNHTSENCHATTGPPKIGPYQYFAPPTPMWGNRKGIDLCQR